MNINLIIQARMSSSRFPGKVLAPVNGKPMISHVVERLNRAFNKSAIIIATSDETSDAPLALYGHSLGVTVFRGSLNDVFERFRVCLQENPCDWFFRVSADSPYLNSKILTTMASYVDDSLDLITNVQKRTFPHGHSLELLNAKTFCRIDPSRLSADDREHVTKFYYAHTGEFRILNFENMDPDYARLNFVVDTLDDLRRVEELENTVGSDFIPQVKVTAE
ncbi:MAG: NTP transferase domain-containing protein [Anaerolineales bacterium]|nr:MAG: NTP transferase domain-containing protein [Anaerolineales bacterium]